MKSTKQGQFEKMTATPVPRLIVALSVPTVISMLITNVYNLVDAYFVGKIGTSASGAIGVVLVIQAVIQAFGFTFGHGAGSIISRKLGEKDTDAAGKFASTSFFSSLLTGAIIAVLGFCFLDPMLRLLGSTETILPYARDYARWILLAAPFMASSCVLNNIMRYEGRAALAMIGLSTGGILNIIADPIFMFGLNMGVNGAGLATALSQAVSFSLLLFMFISGKTQSRISPRIISHSFSDVKNIFLTGAPSLIRQGLNSVSTMALNNAAAFYGDAAVAAMSIVGRICMFIASIMIGIGQGLQPVAAFNYGAGKYSRVKSAFRFTFILGEVCLCAVALAGLIFSGNIISLFRNDPEVISFGIPALQMQCIAMALQPLGVCTNMTFQSIGEKGKAAFVSMLRSGLYFLPTILILPHFVGVFGIQSAQAIADTLTFITALPMIIIYMRKLPNDR